MENKAILDWRQREVNEKNILIFVIGVFAIFFTLTLGIWLSDQLILPGLAKMATVIIVCLEACWFYDRLEKMS
jgi:hypothetical protein